MRLTTSFQKVGSKGDVLHRTLRLALFSVTLLLAAYLRITGLAWGIHSGYGHELNFQPDEFVSLRGVREIDLLTGNLRAPQAYFEGTFNYYLWAVPKAVLKIMGKDDVRGDDSTSGTDHSDLLYVCRWMSVLFDLCTTVVTFLAIKEATGKFYPSLLGALCYAVLPMQVIYAHFMRTHMLSNLLCALVIWISLKLRKSRSWQLLLASSVISGLGAATRYPVGLIVVIPCLYSLSTGNDNVAPWTKRISKRVANLVRGPLWIIGLGFLLGLFIGHPMLFLATSSVTEAITSGTLKYASLHEFSASRLLNLSVVWKYVTYLIPFAMYPFLWLAAYCAIVYVVFRSRIFVLSLPILTFSLLYLYFMAKGYLGPYFARITMLLFPGFCVLIGIACADVGARLKNNRVVAVLLTVASTLVLGPSAAFDVAYARAMRQTDVRQVVRQDLQESIGETPATIGVWGFGAYFYTVMPAVRPLSSDKVTVRLQNPEQDADFFLVGFPRQIGPAQLHAVIRQVEAQGKFRYQTTYHAPVSIFGHHFMLMRFPQDMTIPFPTILLFRAKAATQA